MFKVLVSGCEPSRGSKYSACVDLYASENAVISAGETKLVGLGVCIDTDGLKKASDRSLENLFGQTLDYIIGTCDGDEDIVHFDSFKSSHYLQLMLRSSLSKELVIANGVGVIDLDYEDEIKMIIHNPFTKKSVMAIVMEWVNRLSLKLSKGTFKHEPLNDDFPIIKGDKIAQITLVEHKSYLFGIESDVVRDGGFGSTG